MRHSDGRLHAAAAVRGPLPLWQEQKLSEVAVVGSVAACNVPALTARLRRHCVGSERELCRLERTLRSTLPDRAGDQAEPGLREVRLYSDLHEKRSVLRVESRDRLTVGHVAKARETPCVQARNVTQVPIGASADDFLRSLGFAQTHEVLRRGRSFRRGPVLVSIYQICAAADRSDEAAWSTLDEGGLFVVEAVAAGEQLKPLVEEIDEWADMLEQASVALAPASSTGNR
jgi:hypothetical protein